jgi:phage terminase large subunit-like protein
VATLIPTWAFDDSPIADPHGRAERMLRFADLLRHPKAVGDQGPLPNRWQRRIIQRIYGPSTPDGRRQVSTVFMLVPRGARKTTLASVLALGHTIGPEQRPGGQIVSAASDRTQARLAFDEAVSMVLPDPRLVEATRIRDTKNRIEHNKSRSVYTAISADGDRQHGGTPSFVLADELHVWRGFSLWNALSTGAAKVPGSLKLIITTAGEKSMGVAYDLFEYAKRIAANPERDPSFLPILFQADAQADWEDEDLWHQVNPGLSQGFPDLIELRSEALLARELPRLRSAFKQVHLNIWQDGAAGGWLEMSVYDDGAEPIDARDFEGLDCWVTIDMAKTYDLAGISATFRMGDGGYAAFFYPFITEAALKRRAMELPDVPWQQWVDEGHLMVIPGELIDDDVIEAKLVDLDGVFNVQEMAFDQKFAAKLMGKMLADGFPVVDVPQRPLVLGPMYTELQRAIIARRYRHGGHPVARWCFSNAVPISGDTGLLYMSKAKSTDAIDLVVTAAMGVGRCFAAVAPHQSIYDLPDLPAEADPDIDFDILNDPRHPRWQEMKQRWEARLPPDEDF